MEGLPISYHNLYAISTPGSLFTLKFHDVVSLSWIPAVRVDEIAIVILCDVIADSLDFLRANLLI
jgi:hypothetical protein